MRTTVICRTATFGNWKIEKLISHSKGDTIAYTMQQNLPSEYRLNMLEYFVTTNAYVNII